MSRTGKVFLYLVYFAAIIVLGSFILTSAKVGERPNHKSESTKPKVISNHNKPTSVATTYTAGSTVPKAVATPAPAKKSTPAPASKSSVATTPSKSSTSSSSSSSSSSSASKPSSSSSSSSSSTSSASKPATTPATAAPKPAAPSPATGQVATAATGSSTLTNTGPGDVFALFAAATVAGALGFRFWLIRRSEFRLYR